MASTRVAPVVSTSSTTTQQRPRQRRRASAGRPAWRARGWPRAGRSPARPGRPPAVAAPARRDPRAACGDRGTGQRDVEQDPQRRVAASPDRRPGGRHRHQHERLVARGQHGAHLGVGAGDLVQRRGQQGRQHTAQVAAPLVLERHQRDPHRPVVRRGRPDDGQSRRAGGRGHLAGAAGERGPARTGGAAEHHPTPPLPHPPHEAGSASSAAAEAAAHHRGRPGTAAPPQRGTRFIP